MDGRGSVSALALEPASEPDRATKNRMTTIIATSATPGMRKTLALRGGGAPRGLFGAPLEIPSLALGTSSDVICPASVGGLENCRSDDGVGLPSPDREATSMI